MYFISIFLGERLGFKPSLQLKGWNCRAFQNETLHMRASSLTNGCDLEGWPWGCSFRQDQESKALKALCPCCRFVSSTPFASAWAPTPRPQKILRHDQLLSFGAMWALPPFNSTAWIVSHRILNNSSHFVSFHFHSMKWAGFRIIFAAAISACLSCRGGGGSSSNYPHVHEWKRESRQLLHWLAYSMSLW